MDYIRGAEHQGTLVTEHIKQLMNVGLWLLV